MFGLFVAAFPHSDSFPELHGKKETRDGLPSDVCNRTQKLWIRVKDKRDRQLRFRVLVDKPASEVSEL